MAINTFSFENDTKIVREKSKIKGKLGVTYRFGFPFLPGMLEKREAFGLEDMTPEDPEDENSCQRLAPLWVGHKFAWIDNVGPVFCDDPEIEKFITSKTTAKPKMRVGTVVISYPLDEKGNVNYKCMIEDHNTVVIKALIIDLGKYKKLKEKHNDYYLWNNDLKASLDVDSQENYQKWGFDLPKSKQAFSVLRKLLEKVKEEEGDHLRPLVQNILTRVCLVAEDELEQLIGRHYSVKELKEKLGLVAPSADTSVEVSTDEDVEDQLASLGLS